MYAPASSSWPVLRMANTLFFAPDVPRVMDGTRVAEEPCLVKFRQLLLSQRYILVLFAAVSRRTSTDWFQWKFGGII